MEVVEQIGLEKEGIGKQSQEVSKISALLTNKMGAYLLMAPYPISRYGGLFFYNNNRMFKTVEQFILDKPVTKVINKVYCVERLRGNITETFFMPMDHNAMIYELSEQSEFELVLDCKETFDDREWGRYYDITREHNCVVVKFSKKNHENEKEGEEFEFYLAIHGKGIEYLPLLQWEKAVYEFDKARESPPFERYVFKACKIKCKDLALAFNTDKRKAIKEAIHVYNRRKKLMNEKLEYVTSIIHHKKISDKDMDTAYKCAINAVDSLIVNDVGMFAGIPWFCQFWARDELISLKALMMMKRYGLAKTILFRHLNNIQPDGKLPNRDPPSPLASADSIGWLFKRIEDFIDILDKEGIRKKYISDREMMLIEEKLHYALDLWLKFYSSENIVYSGPLETWMDTEWGDDKREGARIEVQALVLAMLRFLRKFGIADPKEKIMKKAVRQKFFKNGRLSDGVADFTARPNIFIAYYVYPELLSDKEWKSVFRKSLQKLWLKWGGLSTIDKKSKLFTDKYTGQNNKSYHRGDSWFWINNLAALCMWRLDSKMFKRYVAQTLVSSTEEMLYKGITGYQAELSSASELKSEGCLAQLWSNAMFVELINEIF
jgi:glycogen debranching enzyme